MPAYRVAEAVVSRKTGHKFPNSLEAIYWYWLQDTSKFSGHSESWKPAWQSKFLLYGKGYTCNRALTRSSDHCWQYAHTGTTDLASPTQARNLSIIAETAENLRKNLWRHPSLTLDGQEDHTKIEHPQDSADLSLWKLGLDSPLAFWHTMSKVCAPSCDGKMFEYHLAEKDEHFQSLLTVGPVAKMAQKIQLSMTTGMVTKQKTTVQRSAFFDQRDFLKIEWCGSKQD